jgi:AcrR family transcriptional regulator
VSSTARSDPTEPDAHSAASAGQRRRAGRPSVAPERREQILEAVERCIVLHGIERTTLARVAEAAGMPRSALHHFLGNRDALLRAAANRVVGNVRLAVRDGLADVPDEASPAELVEGFLDVIFGAAMGNRRSTRLIDELGVAAAHDDHVAALLAGLYAGVVGELERSLARAFPHAPADEHRTAALAIIGLSDAASRFGDYGFDPESPVRMRAAAARLLASLGAGESSEWRAPS